MKVIDYNGIFMLEDANMIRCTSEILSGRSRVCAVALYAKGGYRTCAVIIDARELDVAGLPKLRRFDTKFHESWAAAQEEYFKILGIICKFTTKKVQQEQVAC
jgi:hypothetical protein